MISRTNNMQFRANRTKYYYYNIVFINSITWATVDWQFILHSIGSINSFEPINFIRISNSMHFNGIDCLRPMKKIFE